LPRRIQSGFGAQQHNQKPMLGSSLAYGQHDFQGRIQADMKRAADQPEYLGGSIRTHYQNLHIDEKASTDVISAVYKSLVQKWQDDKDSYQKNEAEKYFKSISGSFEVLSDPIRREQYDEQLKTGHRISNEIVQKKSIQDDPFSHLAQSFSKNSGSQLHKRFDKKKSGLMGRLWRGDVSLAKTYWLYGVVINALIIFIFFIFLPDSLAALLTFGYLIFISVSIWRSAGNLGPLKLWRDLARLAVIASVLLPLIGIFLAIVISGSR
jgi:hypothetical protein